MRDEVLEPDDSPLKDKEAGLTSHQVEEVKRKQKAGEEPVRQKPKRVRRGNVAR
jgi:hypothetical protein